MPIKTAIIPFLDELSPESRITNACNTIVKVPTANGGIKLVGQNTDSMYAFCFNNDS
jgi:shikimate 5-dehydrogenase